MHFEIYDKSRSSSELPTFEFDERLNAPELYIPSQKLIDAVNVSLSLGQPLLLTGEPGTGKTQLAFHLAHYFGLGEPIVFNVKTSSSANDLFYRYEALKHFQYSQNNGEILEDAEVENRFIRYQALGEAIRIAAIEKRRSIVLIDEIDKAPRDLPNDILGALERLEFEVPEIKKIQEAKIKADDPYRPVIILTSNSEKSLPDAFLRRCVFFHIEIPSQEELKNIIISKISGLSADELSFVTIHFYRMREICQNKKPTTSEFLFWVTFLREKGFQFAKLSGRIPLLVQEKADLQASYSILAKSKEDWMELCATI